MAKISLSSKEKENIIYLLERQIRMAEKALNTPTMGRNNYDDFKNQINNNTITIKPVEIRKGWEEAFKEMHVKGDDALLIEDSTDMDNGGWEW